MFCLGAKLLSEKSGWILKNTFKFYFGRPWFGLVGGGVHHDDGDWIYLGKVLYTPESGYFGE
jgi:hypothetical protein